MIRTLFAPALAAVMVVGGITAASKPAEANRNGRVAAGVAAGIIGLGILGAYANARGGGGYGRCYEVGGGCHWREGNCFYNRYGDYVCRRGYQVCEPRRTVCD
jgi:hypothetical protein